MFRWWEVADIDPEAMVEFTGTTTVVADDGTLSTSIDGESVLLDTDSGTYFGFNEVGSEVWEAIQEPRSVEELTERIVSKYDADRETVRTDVEELLAELANKDLVRIERE
jgi:hypothetical protein